MWENIEPAAIRYHVVRHDTVTELFKFVSELVLIRGDSAGDESVIQSTSEQQMDRFKHLMKKKYK